MGLLLHKDMHAQSSVYVADVTHISHAKAFGNVQAYYFVVLGLCVSAVATCLHCSSAQQKLQRIMCCVAVCAMVHIFAEWKPRFLLLDFSSLPIIALILYKKASSTCLGRAFKVGSLLEDPF